MKYSRTLTPICGLLATALLGLAQSPTPRAAAAPSPDVRDQDFVAPRAPAAPRAPRAPRPPADAWEQTPAPSPVPAAAPMPPVPPVAAWDLDQDSVAPRAAAAPRAPRALRAVAASPDAWDQLPPLPPTPPAAPLAPMPPMPAAAPMPAMAPMPPMPPMAPIEIDLGNFDLDMQFQLNQEMREKVEAARDQVERMKFDMQDRMFAREAEIAAKDMAMSGRFGLAFAPQSSGQTRIGPTPQPAKTMAFRGMSDDRLYSSGQGSLDARHWDQALEYFNQVISRAGSRVDGALFWKSYALGKLGRRDEATAAIAELRKSFATSRWLDDAKALELELRQSSGQAVSPEAESDEDLKLMAINGLMQSDPERAIPLLEGLLKSSASPKVKRNALFVLSQSNSPKAQALVEQIARGGANPDMQLKAIGYMDQRRKPNNNAQILSEIYSSTNDNAVKRAILQAYAGMRDKDRLLQAAKSEKSPELREYAIGNLAGNAGTPELWQLYQTETTTEGKLQLLRYMYSNSSADKLMDVVKNEKDTKVRSEAVRVLASQKSGFNSDSLVTIYTAESDPQIKMSIVDGLSNQRNAKAMVDIARAEKDTKLKLRIVERLSNMKSKEAQDYLEELLKK